MLLEPFAFGYVLVCYHRPQGITVWEGLHLADEPAPFGGRMAGVLHRKLFSVSREHRTYPLGESGGMFGLLTCRRVANPKIVGAFRNVPDSSVEFGKISPSLIDGNDGARAVDDGYVHGEHVQ